MSRSEFLCERCEQRRGVHATDDGLRCDRCLMDESDAAGSDADADVLAALATEATEVLPDGEALLVIVERVDGPGRDAAEQWRAEHPKYTVARVRTGRGHVAYRVIGDGVAEWEPAGVQGSNGGTGESAGSSRRGEAPGGFPPASATGPGDRR